MQWGQIKTIFIVSFLVLNLFLVQELLDKINASNYDTLENRSTFEEQLAEQEITYDLPERGQKEAYVSAQRYQLSEEDLDILQGLLDHQLIGLTSNGGDVVSLDDIPDQDGYQSNYEVITGEFLAPLDLDLEDDFKGSIEEIKSQVLYGDSFQYWNYYEKENVLLFFQKQSDRTFYFNDSASLIVVLNEEGDAIQYRQTFLEELEHRLEEQTVIDPINAIREVWTNTTAGLPSQSEVTLDMGYQTLVPLDDGVQVFVPTWEVIVNNEDHFFVNAMEGKYISHDGEQFVVTMKESLKREIEELKSE
ncbi:two-component system regulatory protein YycI [Piscibacillus halophilus]|uniref:Two-component signal transduction system YycFG, regulatory protein YycI n=1 Tax=Piscibacillus halophilus TaxID=571933 RepID=A0A1H9CYD7_9BACI|nr:two-component system regulatory protein YycI [Piscibacillus halophilus]SEQ06195.1 Two-component signal transduction system YycFG, regulatory protein YycI [Piscibacillus halophilus]